MTLFHKKITEKVYYKNCKITTTTFTFGSSLKLKIVRKDAHNFVNVSFIHYVCVYVVHMYVCI